MPLTDLQIKSAKPGQRLAKAKKDKGSSKSPKPRNEVKRSESQKDDATLTKPQSKKYRLHDGKGLYLEVDASGGKYWRLKYRLSVDACRHLRTDLGHLRIGLRRAWSW
jgi:hypothetical protein